MKELFNMANCNTMLALAYIQESENPLQVICNVIQYCLSVSPSKELRYDILKERMFENLGFSIPNHVINSCIRYLEKKKQIEKIADGAGYRILSSNFDINKFNSDKINLSILEERFIESLCKYTKDYFSIEWDKKEAFNYFADLVLRDSFNESVIESNDMASTKNNYIPNTWYVKKFIFYLLENKSDNNYDYFLKVFNGLLTLNGLTQISDYNQNKQQKFRGTPFYFDTKFLLRLLGFSFPYHTETAMELIRLIRSDYEGKLYVFRHTISEIRYAISLAINDLSKQQVIINYEMEFFRKSHNYSVDDFKIAADSIESRLTKEFGFTIVDGIDWNDLNSRKYCIDTEALNDYLAKSNPEWSKSGIRNDVHSITQINIERNGSYDIKFGGKSRLPIFITSNNKLIHDIKEYTVKCSNNGIPLPWHTNKLPLISDYDLTCRLWLTSKHQEPVSLNLIKSAYLYQQSDNEFYKKILETYQQVKEKHKYNVIDLDYIRFEKLKELIIIDTKGDIESINDDVVATSFEELATRQSLAKDKTIEDLNKQRNAKDIKINQITDSFIKSVSDRYKEKISIFQRLISFGISNLHWIISALGIILVFVFGQLQNEKILSQYNLLAILPIVISIVFEFLDKKVFTESILLKWQNRYKSICKGRFESMIISTLREEELPYKERIIMCSIDNTRFFNTDGKT